MFFKSGHITVTADHGTATLAFGFGGEPANALNLAYLREFEAALDAVASHSAVRVLVVRSAISESFCAGLCPIARNSLIHTADRAAFAWSGQWVLRKLACLDAVSVAFIDGPCLGVGFELALACDFRLCVAQATTRLGFPERFACFCGFSRISELAGRRGRDLLASGGIISGREARQLGLVDVVCSERRARLELHSLLDRLQTRPVKPRRHVDIEGLAHERRVFSAAPIPPISDQSSATASPSTPFPATIGLLGNDAHVEQLAATAALLGASVVVCGDRSGIFTSIADSARRGFITPLEAEQVRMRVRASDTLDGFENAGLVIVADGHNAFRLAAAVRPRTAVCVVCPTGRDPTEVISRLTVPFPFPRRLVRIGFCDADRIALFPDPSTDSEILSALAAWYRQLGYTSMMFPVAARLLPRAA
jgi:enoyl-CoA hydratase/carnithine racemase